jgi:hypothetical protein
MKLTYSLGALALAIALSGAAQTPEVAGEYSKVRVRKGPREETAGSTDPHVSLRIWENRSLSQLLPHRGSNHHRCNKDADRSIRQGLRYHLPQQRRRGKGIDRLPMRRAT